MKLNITGTMFGTSGYDSHTKGLFNSLAKYIDDIKLEVPLVQDWEQHCNHEELISIKRGYRVPDYTICIAPPPQWKLHMNKGKFIGYCVWEGTKIPKYWIDYILDDKVHQIWVPSQHTKDAILNTEVGNDKIGYMKIGSIYEILEEKVKIIPHGYDPKQFYQIKEKIIYDK